MLSNVTINTIEQYVNEKFFDKEKLIKYLDVHTVVGNEVFSYCDKKVGRDGSSSYSSWLDDDYGYYPISVADFIRRMPFYFCVRDYSKSNRFGDLHSLLSGLYRRNDDINKNTLEDLYQAIEFMFYNKKIPLEDIFCYTVDQTGYASDTDMFFRWKHYLQLCDELKWNDYLPECFIATYNEALEKSGLSPIIYEIQWHAYANVYERSGLSFEFEGAFPCDRNGDPIMKWIGLRVKNAKKISCSQKKSCRGRLFVEINPITTIHALNCYNNADDEDTWYQIYAGPQTMQFDYEKLKISRTRLKYTQKEVANAVGATERTYQKWENGETTPDGHYLLRLLNWLDIQDVQDIIQYTE